MWRGRFALSGLRETRLAVRAGRFQVWKDMSMKQYEVAILVGSLRKDSLNRKMAEAFIKLAPPEFRFSFVEIGDLPFYNQDLETETPPAQWTRFRAALQHSDALLFLTPEYNRSVPAVLKNAIDIGSRPYGKGAINGRPAAVISVSPGALGAFGANHHLRQVLHGVGVAVLPSPEVYIGNAAALFADDGSIEVEATRDFLKTVGEKFLAWVQRNPK
jgi:chromate reductase